MALLTHSPKSKRFSTQYFFQLTRFTLAVLLFASIITLVGVVQLHVNVFTVPRRAPALRTPAEIDLAYRDITLTTGDGLNLAGWYIPGSRPNVIILVHGINSNREAELPYAELLSEAGFPLLLFDLRGHGDSEGAEITYGYREALDVKAAVDYLLALPEIEQVGALGKSLGGSVVVRAAATDSRLKAIVVQSSYSSLSRAIEDSFDNMALLPRRPFAPLIIALVERRLDLQVEAVDSVRDLAAMRAQSVLFIHGAEDDMFPPAHAREMYAAANKPKEIWIIDGVGHGIPTEEGRAEYQKRVAAFFEEAFAK